MLLTDKYKAHELALGSFHGTRQCYTIGVRATLLTYYQGPVMTTALERIAASLAKGGVLVVGSHERLPPMGVALTRDPESPWVYRV
jgi:chemotaxis methyl-accepting protein methylase